MKSILWVGPWHSDVTCHQVRGAMSQALHDQGYVVNTIVIGAEDSWKTGGYDHIDYLPKPHGLIGKLINQWRLGIKISCFKGDAIVLGEKAAYLSLFAWLGKIKGFKSEKGLILIDIRTLPIPIERALSQQIGSSFYTRKV